MAGPGGHRRGRVAEHNGTYLSSLRDRLHGGLADGLTMVVLWFMTFFDSILLTGTGFHDFDRILHFWFFSVKQVYAGWSVG